MITFNCCVTGWEFWPEHLGHYACTLAVCSLPDRGVRRAGNDDPVVILQTQYWACVPSQNLQTLQALFIPDLAKRSGHRRKQTEWDTLVTGNKEGQKTRGLRKVINVGHGEKGLFSQRCFCSIYPHCSEHSALSWLWQSPQQYAHSFSTSLATSFYSCAFVSTAIE